MTHTTVGRDYRMRKTVIRSKIVKMVVLIFPSVFPKIYGELFHLALAMMAPVVEAGNKLVRTRVPHGNNSFFLANFRKNFSKLSYYQIKVLKLYYILEEEFFKILITGCSGVAVVNYALRQQRINFL